MRVAYLFPLFPVINQTFTLFEALWLKKYGYDIRVISLQSGVDVGKQQQEAVSMIEETVYCPSVKSLALWKPFFRALFSRPKDLLGLFWLVYRSWSRKVPKRESEHAGTPETFTRSEMLLAIYHSSTLLYLLRSFLMVPYAVYVAEVLEREKIPHVHCQWATYPATVGMLIQQWAGIPFSLSAHAYDIYLMPRMLPEKLERASFAVTCADYNRSYLSELCSPEAAKRIHLNYHGTDLQRFRPVEEKVPSDTFRIVSAGWLKEYKGFHYILDAVEILAKRGVDVEFHLAGDGPQKEYLEKKAAESGISDRLVLHGFVDHERLSRIYSESDAFVIGSIEMSSLGRQDVIPNVIAEAMAVGIPVVATRMAGIPELVHDGVDGLLVPQRDPQAMADALDRLRTDEAAAQKMADSARAKILDIWDRDANCRELTKIFESYIEIDSSDAPGTGGGGRSEVAA